VKEDELSQHTLGLVRDPIGDRLSALRTVHCEKSQGSQSLLLRSYRWVNSMLVALQRGDMMYRGAVGRNMRCLPVKDTSAARLHTDIVARVLRNRINQEISIRDLKA
jgi:hypothetical protein